MREIKFRAWHKKLKEYFQVKKIEFSIFGDGRNYFLLVKDGLEVDAYTDDIVLEQYTGLHDKNGVEIVVGDIVLEEDGFIGEVYSTDYIMFHENMEVIGNIHENEDLVK